MKGKTGYILSFIKIYLIIRDLKNKSTSLKTTLVNFQYCLFQVGYYAIKCHGKLARNRERQIQSFQSNSLGYLDEISGYLNIQRNQRLHKNIFLIFSAWFKIFRSKYFKYHLSKSFLMVKFIIEIIKGENPFQIDFARIC